MTWTHDVLQEDLAQYVREKTRGMVWANMQMGPAGSLRPDAYSLPFNSGQPIPAIARAV